MGGNGGFVNPRMGGLLLLLVGKAFSWSIECSVLNCIPSIVRYFVWMEEIFQDRHEYQFKCKRHLRWFTVSSQDSCWMVDKYSLCWFEVGTTCRRCWIHIGVETAPIVVHVIMIAILAFLTFRYSRDWTCTKESRLLDFKSYFFWLLTPLPLSKSIYTTNIYFKVLLIYKRPGIFDLLYWTPVGLRHLTLKGWPFGHVDMLLL